MSSPRGPFPPAHRHPTRTPTPNPAHPAPRRPKQGESTNRTQNYAKEEKAQLCSLCLPGEILCILSSDPTSAESDQLGLLCCQPEPVADTSTPLGGFLTASTHWRTICQVRSSHLHASDHMTTATAIPRQVVTGVIPSVRMEHCVANAWAKCFARSSRGAFAPRVSSPHAMPAFAPSTCPNQQLRAMAPSRVCDARRVCRAQAWAC